MIVLVVKVYRVARVDMVVRVAIVARVVTILLKSTPWIGIKQRQYTSINELQSKDLHGKCIYPSNKLFIPAKMRIQNTNISDQ